MIAFGFSNDDRSLRSPEALGSAMTVASERWPKSLALLCSWKDNVTRGRTSCDFLCESIDSYYFILFHIHITIYIIKKHQKAWLCFLMLYTGEIWSNYQTIVVNLDHLRLRSQNRIISCWFQGFFSKEKSNGLRIEVWGWTSKSRVPVPCQQNGWTFGRSRMSLV